MDEANLLELASRQEWRAWLKNNHARVEEVWLVFFKKKSGVQSISYSEALDEALCYGWIDSLIKRINKVRYARKFTPRRDNSKWSLVNKNRVEHLMNSGLMTEFGLQKVEAAKQSGKWEHPNSKPKLDFSMSTDFQSALQNNPQAEKNFNKLAKTHQNQYIAWIITAKRSETISKRISESIKLLSEGKKLGLK